MTKIIINRNNKVVDELRKVVKNQNLRGYYIPRLTLWLCYQKTDQKTTTNN